MDTEAAIKHLAREVDDAYNDADPTTMAGYWTENGLNINPFGDRFQGRANIEADLREGLGGFMKGSQHNLAVSYVASLNDQTAVADGTATITGIVGFDGKTIGPLASNFSMICTRDQDGDWRIAQMRAYRFIPRRGVARVRAGGTQRTTASAPAISRGRSSRGAMAHLTSLTAVSRHS